jgi:ATP-dependent helicase HrpB
VFPAIHARLPVEALREDLFAAIASGPVVITSPTGSGKSTCVPAWLAAAGHRVLVVEPRRVACRSLASRVAELAQVLLGGPVGYRVRDEDRASMATRVLFATPGVVLRMFADGVHADFDAIVIDELHERTLDGDLILALAQARGRGVLVAMSATIEGERVAAHLGGRHLEAIGRTHPVQISYCPDGDQTLPQAHDLPRRVGQALDGLPPKGHSSLSDVLVFLPGKAEIAACAQLLERRSDLCVIPLHGDLDLPGQARAFAPSSRRKVILSTNVAETSLTLPGIGLVIDAGLVRRTRYAGGRGFLTRMPIAQDAADQRAGRAGRLGPGRCIRLWSARARLESSTPPEIHRESLVPLVLAAAAAGRRVPELPLLDPPREHALEAAETELRALGAIDERGCLTATGRALFGLPLDASLGRWLVEARTAPPALAAGVADLVAALATGRPLFSTGPDAFDPLRGHPEDDLRAGGCDATALILAVRRGDPARHGLRPAPLAEARRNARRLRSVLGLPPTPGGEVPDRRGLAELLLSADPRLAHIARRRKREVAWSNGGTEVELARESALARLLETPAAQIDAALLLEVRALGLDVRRTQLVATCALPVPLTWLASAGLGQERVAAVTVQRGRRLIATLERVYAKRTLSTREAVPEGPLARAALEEAFLAGRLWPDTLARTRDHLAARALAARLAGEGPRPDLEVETWVTARVVELGVESGEDLALLGPLDLLAPDLPAAERAALDARWPRRIELPDATLSVEYDLSARTVRLTQVAGGRRDPPPIAWLPAFPGFAIELRHRNTTKIIRPRR